MSDEKPFVYTRFFFDTYEVFVSTVYKGHLQCNIHVKTRSWHGFTQLCSCIYEVLWIPHQCIWFLIVGCWHDVHHSFSTCRSKTVRQSLVQTPLFVTIRFAPDNKRHLPTILLFKSIWQSRRNVRFFFKITMSVSFICTQRRHQCSYVPWHHMYPRCQML